MVLLCSIMFGSKKDLMPGNRSRPAGQDRGGALALGLPFYVVMAVPFVGWILGPLFGGMMGMVAAFRWNSMRACSAVE